MTISKVEAQALAAFVARCRDDWDHPGIVAAITKASHLGSPAAIGAALCRLAENRELRTPAMLADPGTHWTGTTVAKLTPPVMCPDHPGQPAGRCPACDAETTPPPTGWRDDVTLTRRTRPKTRPEPTHDLADVRARADAEEAP
jgi:hypothetical protein